MFNINGLIWEVHFVPPYHSGLMRSDGSYALGVCDNSEQILYINDFLSPKLKKKVLCHEIAHSAMFSYGIILDIWQEEIIVDLIATYGHEIIHLTDEIEKREIDF